MEMEKISLMLPLPIGYEVDENLRNLDWMISQSISFAIDEFIFLHGSKINPENLNECVTFTSQELDESVQSCMDLVSCNIADTISFVVNFDKIDDHSPMVVNTTNGCVDESVLLSLHKTLQTNGVQGTQSKMEFILESLIRSLFVHLISHPQVSRLVVKHIHTTDIYSVTIANGEVHVVLDLHEQP